MDLIGMLSGYTHDRLVESDVALEDFVRLYKTWGEEIKSPEDFSLFVGVVKHDLQVGDDVVKDLTRKAVASGDADQSLLNFLGESVVNEDPLTNAPKKPVMPGQPGQEQPGQGQPGASTTPRPEIAKTDEQGGPEAGEEQLTDEQEEAEQLPEKEYLGSKEGEFFYINRKGSDTGDIEDVLICDAKGDEVFSARKRGIDYHDMVALIRVAIDELDIDEISSDILDDYDFLKEDEPEENLEEIPQGTPPAEANPGDFGGETMGSTFESRINENDNQRGIITGLRMGLEAIKKNQGNVERAIFEIESMLKTASVGVGESVLREDELGSIKSCLRMCLAIVSKAKTLEEAQAGIKEIATRWGVNEGKLTEEDSLADEVDAWNKGYNQGYQDGLLAKGPRMPRVAKESVIKEGVKDTLKKAGVDVEAGHWMDSGSAVYFRGVTDDIAQAIADQLVGHLEGTVILDQRKFFKVVLESKINEVTTQEISKSLINYIKGSDVLKKNLDLTMQEIQNAKKAGTFNQEASLDKVLKIVKEGADMAYKMKESLVGENPDIYPSDVTLKQTALEIMNSIKESVSESYEILASGIADEATAQSIAQSKSGYVIPDPEEQGKFLVVMDKKQV